MRRLITAAWKNARSVVRQRVATCAVFVAVASAGMMWQAVHVRSQSNPPFDTIEKLGEALFFDVNLSKNRTEACASCHSPDRAFTDPRSSDGVGRAVSVGDDGHSLGDRNAPTAAYAAFSPTFRIKAKGKPVGGYFHDGRASTLEDQAAGPPLNPIEMEMPDKAAVAARIKVNAAYVTAFNALFGAGTLQDADAAYAAMTKSIAAFERTDVFQPFDSKYDRSLRGEAQLTEQEELGRLLFFSSQFSNCSQCHKLRTFGGAERETFSNYEYHNIGTPVNMAVCAHNGSAPGRVDRGLQENPAASTEANAGKFKVPTLRNVAVTAPYMHNGVFNDLETVVKFYNKYNSKNPRHKINPETGAAWAPPEVAETISKKELESGSALNSKRVKALVAFLKTLTDKRYEHLLKP